MRYATVLTLFLLSLAACLCAGPAASMPGESASATDTPPGGEQTEKPSILQVTLKSDYSLREKSRADASVRGQFIYLRDVATVTSASEDRQDSVEKALAVYVGSASLPGEIRIVTQGQILTRLRGAGFQAEEIEFTGPAQVKTIREAQVIPAQEIRDRAVEAVREKVPWPAEDVTIEVVREPKDLTVAQGALEVRAAESFGYQGFGQGFHGFSPVSVPVEILLDGKLCQKVTVPIRVRAYATIAVAAADIARGELITEDMVKMTRLDLSTCGGKVAADPGQVVGKQATSAIRAGQPVCVGAVDEPSVVKRGDTVTVISRFGSVVARSPGEAKKDGRIGDTIPVKVSCSEKELQAVVVDAATVEVKG